MWTLECDGDILNNKRIWLRPGKKYLFGRTLPETGKSGAFQLKDEKSVSRQHLTLTVSNVNPGDGSRVHTRSDISLKDEGTKFGTEIDKDRIKGETKTLKSTEHTFKLGKSNYIFKIKWHPVVFTFSLSSKDTKGGKDPLNNYRNRLEDLDIKVSQPYVIGQTSHVVSSKRNTAKGLQALINGKFIVAESYIDALVYSTTPDNLDELESLSPLEEDFDNGWPNAQEHLPAKSKEPSERPAEDFRPNATRANIFEGYTFIFCDALQFETLQAPITNGGGKALAYTLEQGKTTAEEIVRYVKNVAGEKGLGEFEDGSEGKGVVVVAFRGKKGQEQWAANLSTAIALALGQRLIEQSEFLEAILSNDASILRRSLLPEEQDSLEQAGNDQAPAPSQDLAEPEKDPEAEATESRPRRGRHRERVVSRFKGFDDDDDDDAPVVSTPYRPDNTASQIDSVPRTGRSERHTTGTSHTDPTMDGESPSQFNGEVQPANPRKRPAPSQEDDDDERMVDKLLPAATAMKRRRIEEAEEAERNGVSAEHSFDTSQVKPEKAKARKPRKEVNIRDVVRERREAEEEEEAAKRDEENMRDTIDGMNVEEMKNLAVVEEMEVPKRATRPQRGDAESETNDRWDERWNGRKNFKKFRRRGEDPVARRGNTVIVPLEEVKKKDYGIGEDYWLESEKTKKQRKQKDRTTQSQSQSQSQPFTTARSQATEVPSELAIDGELPDAIDVDAPRITRHQEHTQQTNETPSTGRSPVVNRKRPAPSQPSDNVKKKLKFAVEDSESDSEDELKFRFKKTR